MSAIQAALDHTGWMIPIGLDYPDAADYCGLPEKRFRRQVERDKLPRPRRMDPSDPSADRFYRKDLDYWLTPALCTETDAAVYFLRIKGMRRVKIGISIRPRSRLNSLMTACPFETELMGLIPGNRGVERQLHEEFDKQRCHGEWFDMDQRMEWRLRGLTLSFGDPDLIDLIPPLQFEV